MPTQQIPQYSSGKARSGLSQYQSRGSQVPTPYQSSWSSRANTATGQAGTQGSWYANSSSRPLSATSPAANSQYGNMGSWSQGNTEQASSQDFNQYLDSVMSTKTPTGTQSRQQVQPGPLPWDTRWMPEAKPEFTRSLRQGSEHRRIQRRGGRGGRENPVVVG